MRCCTTHTRKGSARAGSTERGLAIYGWPRRRAAVRVTEIVPIRQLDEQRARLEDRVVRTGACNGTARSTKRTGPTRRSDSSIPGLTGDLLRHERPKLPDSRHREFDIARVTNGLTLQGAASWNHSVQTNSPALIDGNPASVNYGKQITEACHRAGAHCAPVSNISAQLGRRRLTRRLFSSACARAMNGAR